MLRVHKRALQRSAGRLPATVSSCSIASAATQRLPRPAQLRASVMAVLERKMAKKRPAECVTNQRQPHLKERQAFLCSKTAPFFPGT